MGKRFLSSPKRPNRLCGSPVFCSMAIRGFFLGREDDHSPLMPRVGMSGVIPPFLYMLSWLGQSMILLPVTDLRVYCDTYVHSVSCILRILNVEHTTQCHLVRFSTISVYVWRRLLQLSKRYFGEVCSSKKWCNCFSNRPVKSRAVVAAVAAWKHCLTVTFSFRDKWP
jgi:hypothetical protein